MGGIDAFLDRFLVPSHVKASRAMSPAREGCCMDREPEALGRRNQILWSGHLFDHSGYARANREFLFRLANTFIIQLDRRGVPREASRVDGYTTRRLQAHVETRVASQAPLLRFYVPIDERRNRHRRRICFTMMETEKIHPEMARVIRENYDELWTPTRWNRDRFLEAGVDVDTRVVPLGVDTSVFRPLSGGVVRPLGRLLTTKRAETREVPEGFTFVTLFHPTFRKGIDILTRAFERAFGGDPDAASLILATTVYGRVDAARPFGWDRGGPEAMKSKIYSTTGILDDESMAAFYTSFDAYVSSSRGEGWNLPLMEAAACGLPVVASRCSSHAEILSDDDAFLFDPEGFRPCNGSSSVLNWYGDQPFAYFGNNSIDQLADFLRRVAGGERRSRSPKIPTWDEGASIIRDRILEIVS